MSKIDVEKFTSNIDEELLTRFFKEAEDENQQLIFDGTTEDFLNLPLPDCYINRLNKQKGTEECKDGDSEYWEENKSNK